MRACVHVCVCVCVYVCACSVCVPVCLSVCMNPSLSVCMNPSLFVYVSVLIHSLVSLVAAAVRDLRNDAVPFMAGIVRHITMVAVVQQCSKYIQLRINTIMQLHIWDVYSFNTSTSVV